MDGIRLRGENDQGVRLVCWSLSEAICQLFNLSDREIDSLETLPQDLEAPYSLALQAVREGRLQSHNVNSVPYVKPWTFAQWVISECQDYRSFHFSDSVVWQEVPPEVGSSQLIHLTSQANNQLLIDLSEPLCVPSQSERVMEAFCGRRSPNYPHWCAKALWSEHEATSLVYDREPDDTDFLTRYFKLMNDFYMVLPEEHKHYEDEIPGFYFYEQLLAPLREALSVAFKEELDCKLDGETPKATPIDILRWCTEKGIPIAPELQGCLEKTVGPTSRIHESDGRAHGNSTSLGTTLDKPKAKSHPIGKQTKLPSSRIVQQIENWSKVTIRVDEERVDGLWIRVTGNKQGVFVSAADLGFVDTRGRHIRVWNVLYDAIEAPKEGEDKKTHASIAYAYHPRIKKVTVRQYVDKINTILRAYFNIATDPFVSTVRGKSTLYSGEWLSLFEVRD